MIVTLANRITQLVVPPRRVLLDPPRRPRRPRRTSSHGGEEQGKARTAVVSSGHRVLGFSSPLLPPENFGRGRRACPVLACQLRNRDLTVVTCSVSTIVRRTERGVQPGCDDGLHDGRTGGQHDTSAAHRSHLPQSVPLPAGVLWTSLIKVRTWTLQSAARSVSPRRIHSYDV